MVSLNHIWKGSHLFTEIIASHSQSATYFANEENLRKCFWLYKMYFAIDMKISETHCLKNISSKLNEFELDLWWFLTDTNFVFPYFTLVIFYFDKVITHFQGKFRKIVPLKGFFFSSSLKCYENCYYHLWSCVCNKSRSCHIFRNNFSSNFVTFVF